MTAENKLYFQAEKEAIFLILTGIGDEIYSTVDACNTAKEMWTAIERLQQGESLNVQDVKTNLFWEFGKFTSRDGESMESYYSRFYKLMNELTRNNLQVSPMQVNVQFLQQLQPECRFKNEVNDIRSEKLARSANPLALLAAAQPNSDNYYEAPVPQRSNAPSFKQSSSTRTSASTRHKGKEIAKPVTPQSESVSEKTVIQNSSEGNKDMQRTWHFLLKGKFGNQRTVTVAGARETVGSTVVQKNGIQCSIRAEQAIGEDTDERLNELEIGSTLQLHGKVSREVSLRIKFTDTHWYKADSNVIHLISSKYYTYDNRLIIFATVCVDEPCGVALSNLDESSRVRGRLLAVGFLGDSSLIDLQAKQTELEKVTQCLYDLTVIHSTSISRPQLKCYQVKEKVMPNISQVKFTKKESSKTIIGFLVFSKYTKSVTCSVMTVKNSQNFKFLGTVRFGNDQFAPILGYGDMDSREFQDQQVVDPDSPTQYLFKKQLLNSNLFPWLTLHQSSMVMASKAFLIGTSDYITLLSKKESCDGLPKLTYDETTRQCSKYFLTMIQRNLQDQVITVRNDRGTEGISCVLVGYSTLSKGYHVYNKRTRLIVESIHIKFDEIKEMMSNHNSLDLAPQQQEMSVENVSLGLVPQGQKVSDYDRSDLVPPRQNVVPTAEKTDSSQQRLEFLFSPLLEEYYTPAHGHVEDNNNDQASNASFQDLNLSILFVHGYKKLVSLPHATLIIPMCIHFNHKVMITDGPEIIY
ncbi:hypothetical protein Tco_1310713 [Tanacetum coccineum]